MGDGANGDATVEQPRPGPGGTARGAVPSRAGERDARSGLPPEGTPTDSAPTAQLAWSGPATGTDRSGGSGRGDNGSMDEGGRADATGAAGMTGAGVPRTAEYPLPGAAEPGQAAVPEWPEAPPSDRPDASQGEPAYGRPPDLVGHGRGGSAPENRWRDALHTTTVWTRRLVVCAVITVVLSPLLVAFRVWYVARQDSTPRSDAVIVLGAAQYNGRPSPVFQWRLMHAARLYKEGVAPVVVTVGGGQPGDRYTEAGSGRQWLADHGVPANKIVAVGKGTNTEQSLVAVGREFRRHDWSSAVLVSDPWHALRTRTMARDQGIEAETSPTRSGPIVQTRGTQARYIVRETGAYLNYLLGRT